MLRIVITLFFFIYAFDGYSQDISGKWYGNFGQYGLTVKVEELVVEFEVYNDSMVKGTSYLYYSRRNYEQYNIEGSYREADSTLYFSEVSEVEVRPGTLNSNMMGTYSMKLKDLQGIVRFEGKWQENEPSNYKRMLSTVWLQKLPPAEKEKPVIIPDDKPIIAVMPPVSKFRHPIEKKVHPAEIPARLVTISKIEGDNNRLKLPSASVFSSPQYKNVQLEAYNTSKVRMHNIEVDRNRLQLPNINTINRPEHKSVHPEAYNSNKVMIRDIPADRYRVQPPRVSTFNKPGPKNVQLEAYNTSIVSMHNIAADRSKIQLPYASTFSRPEHKVVHPEAFKTSNIGMLAIEVDRVRMELPITNIISKPEYQMVAPIPNQLSQLTKSDIGIDRIRKPRPSDTNLKRNTIIDKTIGIGSTEKDSVKIEIVDNAKIDDDVISIYINDSLVLHKQRISEIPVVLYVMLNKNIPVHTIKMAAESYGSMPPCTAHITVTANNQKHEFDLESYFNKNSGFTLRLNTDNE